MSDIQSGGLRYFDWVEEFVIFCYVYLGSTVFRLSLVSN